MVKRLLLLTWDEPKMLLATPADAFRNDWRLLVWQRSAVAADCILNVSANPVPKQILSRQRLSQQLCY